MLPFVSAQQASKAIHLWLALKLVVQATVTVPPLTFVTLFPTVVSLEKNVNHYVDLANAQ